MKKRTMEKEHQAEERRKKVLMEIAGAVVVLTVIVSIGLSHLGTDKVKVQNALVGGGFGGKEDMTVQHLAALLTYVTKKPVKMKLSRAESLLVHPKRHPFYMDMTMGCDENGNIMGVKAKVKADTGVNPELILFIEKTACVFG